MRAPQRVLSAIPALLLAMPVFAQEPGRAGMIWQDRGDAAALDLVGGPRGKDHEPGNTFTFIEESSGGTSPKFDVLDEHGTTWKVKLGEETKSETAATRLLWAAGYLVDEVYHRPSIRVLGLPRLARGREFVSGDTVSDVRLERERDKRPSTTWSWYKNPFVGTREFNGLRVMMALINNWDLKEANNRASETAGGVRYEVTDLGATFGRTGNIVTRSKSISKDYAGSSTKSRPQASISSSRAGHFSPWLSTCPTIALGRGWRASSRASRSLTRAGSAITSGNCLPRKSAMASGPADSRPPTSRRTRRPSCSALVPHTAPYPERSGV